MTVVDVNTGKFTGSGGNLEETVTKNNLEAAEEIVRQLRLRDIGGIIVVDFIDMVLESNRDLVLRRLVECLGRDRTRHQVAEVTSLGLVQMTRKRIGTGLLEAFSETCEHCQGRGLIIHEHPVEPKGSDDDGGRCGTRRAAQPRRSGPGRRRRRRQRATATATANGNGNGGKAPSPKDVAAMARPPADDDDDDVVDDCPTRRGGRRHGRRERRPREPDPGGRRVTRRPGRGVRREPLRARARAGAGAGAGAGARAGARAGEAHGRHPHPPPERQPPGRAPARAGDGEAPTAIGNREGAVGAPPATAWSSRAPPGTATPVRQPTEAAPPHVEHVPIKRKRSRKR